MIRSLPRVCILGLVILGISLGCSTLVPSGPLGVGGCIAQDGAVSAWSNTKTILLTFKVTRCQIHDLIIGLSPVVAAQDAAADSAIQQIWIPETIEIRGAQFSIDHIKGVKLSGTFTTPADMEGDIRIVQGAHFDTNPYLIFTADFQDRWAGAIT